MKIIHYQDPVVFQETIQAYLVRREAENNLLFGILANIIAGEYSDHKNYLALVKDAGQIQAVVLCTVPWPALISYENPTPEEQVLEAILADLQETLQDDFNGLSGNREFVTPLVSAWEQDSGRSAVLKMSMQIYKLEQVQPVGGVAGRMRSVEERDRNILENWYTSFYRDIQETEPDQEYAHNQIEAYFTADPFVRGLKVWDVEGQPVSMAGYTGPTPNGIRIGAVYTPPNQRRKGYASAVTAGVCQDLLDMGYKFCFLFADLLNPTSNHIYQEVGFHPICEAERYLFI